MDTEPGRKEASIWTIGHSTHSVAEFISLLKNAAIKRIADVRTVPRSRHVPQFNKDSLAKELPAAGIGYVHMEGLGGWRRPVKDSNNTGWRNAGFRGFADYLQTEAFHVAASTLMALAAEMPTAIMCAESMPFRCHRFIISDFLTVQGVKVIHIYPDGKQKPHQLSSMAVVLDGVITYPPAQQKLI